MIRARARRGAMTGNFGFWKALEGQARVLVAQNGKDNLLPRAATEFDRNAFVRKSSLLELEPSDPFLLTDAAEDFRKKAKMGLATRTLQEL